MDSINSDPQLTVRPAECSGLEMGSLLRAETESGVRSFLHSSKQSELWNGALSPPRHLDTPGRQYLQQIILIITSQYLLSINGLTRSCPVDSVHLEMIFAQLISSTQPPEKIVI